MNFPNPTVDYLERDNNLEKNLYSNKESMLYEKNTTMFPYEVNLLRLKTNVMHYVTSLKLKMFYQFNEHKANK